MVALSVWTCFAIGTAHGASDGPAIRSLAVRGAAKIETSTIMSRSTLAVGGAADAAAIREAIKAIYRMGYFDDVSIEQEPGPDGVNLVIVVSERPTLTEVRYEGYSQIGEDKLKEQVTLTPQTAVDLRAVNAAATKIQQYYQSEGYADARVIPVTKTVSPGAVSVTFYLEEGRRAKIRAVTFEGNTRVPTKRLRNVVATKPYFWLTSWVTSRGIFKHDDLEQDAERLRDFYLNEGYVQVQVGTPNIVSEPNGKGLRVTYPVEEGEQYTVARITLSGHTVLASSELSEGLVLHEGDIFRRNLLRQDMSLLTDRYGERGYAFVDIRPQFVPRPESRSIDLTYEIREGRPVMVRTVAVEGNEKTYDWVIRRELRVAEQELVNTKALKRSFQRINNLNFFENVEILPNPIGDDQMDITVRVKEKPTGTFSLGGGYSSVDQVVYQANIEQGNLFGRGQLLRARLEKSTKRTSNYSITFREPYLFDRPVAGTVDLYSNERRLTTYKNIRNGFSLGLNRWFGEYVSGGVTYTREITKLFDLTTYNLTPPVCSNPSDVSTCVDPDPSDNATPDAPPAIVTEAARGKVTTSSVGVTLARDTRDFAFDPREGQRHSLSIEYAGGPLQGDNRFYRIITDHSAFFPAFWRTVFSLHLRFGYLAGEQYPFAERFVVGGINTVRGFDYGAAGRVDPRTGEIFGGNKELIFNAEYVFPLIQDAKMKGVLFFDAGRSFDDQGRCCDPTTGDFLKGPDDKLMSTGEPLRIRDLRYSMGFGIRMLLPIGPIRLEWGYNLDSQPGEKTGAFPEFTIGSVF